MLKNQKARMPVMILLMAAVFAAAVSAVNASGPSRADLSRPPRPDFSYLPEKIIAPPSYRSPLDTCFDVPLRELAQCRSESRVLALIPVTGAKDANHLSDYYQRIQANHPALFQADAADSILRPSGLRSGNAAVDTADYALRH